jgi:L-amino acid N-acyltransferase YncA
LRQVGQKFNRWFDAVYMQLLLSANPQGGTNGR